MKHQITPEQFNLNEDVPSATTEYPVKAISFQYNPEAGAYASLSLPNDFDNMIRARVHFLKQGGATRMGVDISFNFYPVHPTNFVSASVAEDVYGPDGQITTSDWVDLSAGGDVGGNMVSVKVMPKLDETTENEDTIIAMVEIDFGSY